MINRHVAPEGPDTLQSRLLDKADLPWRIITNYPMFVGHGIAVQNATEVAHQEKNPDEIYGLYIGRAHEKALIARWEAIVELVNGLRDAASALASPPQLLAACRYWADKKMALDAVRPDFTKDQLRELNAAEGRLLSAIYEALASPPEHDERTKMLRDGPALPASTVPATATINEADSCDHGTSEIPFDEAAASTMDSYDVRERWPRRDGPCPKDCGWNGIAYASYAHYIAGDW
jgi:hypothetical protein